MKRGASLFIWGAPQMIGGAPPMKRGAPPVVGGAPQMKRGAPPAVGGAPPIVLGDGKIIGGAPLFIGGDGKTAGDAPLFKSAKADLPAPTPPAKTRHAEAAGFLRNFATAPLTAARRDRRAGAGAKGTSVRFMFFPRVATIRTGLRNLVNGWSQNSKSVHKVAKIGLVGAAFRSWSKGNRADSIKTVAGARRSRRCPAHRSGRVEAA